MKPFVRQARDARQDQVCREALLAQPPEYFRQFFGVTPTRLQQMQVVAEFIQKMDTADVYTNDVYRVRVHKAGSMIQLDISRLDGEPCTNWRDFQQIKNELIGPECEAVELFPAESRLVDTASQCHLWVMPDARYRFPFGYAKRLVFDP